MKNYNDILAEVVGQTDAAWAPIRENALRCGAGISRMAWRKKGAPYLSKPGSTDAEKMARSRLVGEMASAGLLILLRSEDSRTQRVRLSDAGDAAAREAVGLMGLDSTLWMLQRLAELPSCEISGARWTPETLLAEIQWGEEGHALAMGGIQERALPGLVRLWIESRTDAAGRAYYRALPEGLAALKKWTPVAPAIPKYKKPMLEIYRKSREQMRDILRREVSPELGDIGLPTCGWSAEFSKQHAEYFAAKVPA